MNQKWQKNITQEEYINMKNALKGICAQLNEMIIHHVRYLLFNYKVLNFNN